MSFPVKAWRKKWIKRTCTCGTTDTRVFILLLQVRGLQVSQLKYLYLSSAPSLSFYTHSNTPPHPAAPLFPPYSSPFCSKVSRWDKSEPPEIQRYLFITFIIMSCFVLFLFLIIRSFAQTSGVLQKRWTGDERFLPLHLSVFSSHRLPSNAYSPPPLLFSGLFHLPFSSPPHPSPAWHATFEHVVHFFVSLFSLPLQQDLQVSTSGLRGRVHSFLRPSHSFQWICGCWFALRSFHGGAARLRFCLISGFSFDPVLTQFFCFVLVFFVSSLLCLTISSAFWEASPQGIKLFLRNEMNENFPKC